jgi:signal transduction histidine kinase
VLLAVTGSGTGWRPVLLLALAATLGAVLGALAPRARAARHPGGAASAAGLLRAHAHDLRHPLANLESLLAVQPLPAAQPRLATAPGMTAAMAWRDALADNVAALRAAVEDLLAMTTLDELAAQRAAVDVDAFIAGTVRELAAAARRHQRRVDVDAGSLGFRHIPAALLRRALQNVLANALVHAGGRHVTVCAQASGDWLCVEVANDRGPAHAADPGRIGGLGQRIVAELCQAAGGSVETLRTACGRHLVRLRVPAPPLPMRQAPPPAARIAWFDPHDRATGVRRALAGTAIDVDDVLAAARVRADALVVVDASAATRVAALPPMPVLLLAGDRPLPPPGSRLAAAARLQLPVAASDVRTALRDLLDSVSAATTRRRQVLVVDDDPIARAAAVDAVLRAGLQPLPAATVADALRIALGNRVDAALVDRHVGTDDGLRLVEHLRAAGFAGTACIVSADAPPPHAPMRWLQKPLDAMALSRALGAPAQPGDAPPSAVMPAHAAAGQASLAQSFMDELAGELDAIAACCRDGAFAAAGARVHRLRGAASVIGLQHLDAALRRLQAATSRGEARAALSEVASLHPGGRRRRRGPRPALPQAGSSRGGRNSERLRGGPER